MYGCYMERTMGDIRVGVCIGECQDIANDALNFSPCASGLLYAIHIAFPNEHSLTSEEFTQRTLHFNHPLQPR